MTAITPPLQVASRSAGGPKAARKEKMPRRNGALVSGPFQMKSAVLIPDFATRVGPLPDRRAQMVNAHGVVDGTRKAERRRPHDACLSLPVEHTEFRRLRSERIPYAIEQTGRDDCGHRDQDGGNEVMQHVAGDVSERSPEQGRQGHDGYLSGGSAESSRTPLETRTISRRVVPSVAAPRPCRLAQCSGTARSPSPRLPRFAPARAASFRCTPWRSGARRNRARA
jgi:hypothetical protein